MIEDKIFHAPDGSNHAVQVPGVTVVYLQEHGEHHVGDDGVPVCQGVDIKYKGRILHQGLQDSQFTISIREEKLEWRRQADAITVLTARETLRCMRAEQGCAGLLYTYYWGRTQEDCEWKWVRDFQGIRLGSLITGFTDRVLFNISGMSIQAPANCPAVLMMPTQLPDIRIATTNAREFDPIAPWDANLVDEIELSAEHLNFRLDEIQQLFAAAGAGCPDVSTSEDDEIVPVKPPTFGLRRGAVWYEFQCTPVDVHLRDVDRCWDMVPVDHPDLPFISPTTKVLHADATHVPCTPTFPLTLLDQGRVFAVDPHVRMVNTPDYKASTPHMTEITLRVSPGLYTRQELLQWRTVTQLGPMRRQMTSSLLLGSCKASQSCGIQTLQTGDAYNFNLLQPLQDMAELLPWWTRLPSLIWSAMDITGRVGGSLALVYLALFAVSYFYRLSAAAWRRVFWTAVPALHNAIDVLPPSQPDERRK
jgi:hypothetical protein